MEEYILWFDQLGMADVERVGGKNASLGEMISNLSGVGVTLKGVNGYRRHTPGTRGVFSPFY